jgi:outer membrane lipoprotein-sorting protein
MKHAKSYLSAMIMILACASGLQAESPDPEALIRAARDYQGATSMQTRLKLTVVDKDGGTSERLIDEYMVRENGIMKSMTVFQKPASLQGTRLLIVGNKGRDSDRWIFLPSLGKSKRVAGAEGGGSFMGTDLSYDDLSPHDASKDNHRILREEAVDGEACYVIETVAKDPADSDYSRVMTWISKEKSVALRMEMYDKQGVLKKRLETSKIEKVDGVWVSRSYRMETVADKTSTALEMTIIQFNRKIPAGVFTTKYLETGNL